MSAWPGLKNDGWLATRLPDRRAREYWTYLFDRNKALGDAGSWDYAWQCSSWIADGLSIQPRVNLVTNIGFGPDGTHGTHPGQQGANTPAFPIPFPLVHPTVVAADTAADDALEHLLFGGQLQRLLDRIGARVRNR